MQHTQTTEAVTTTTTPTTEQRAPRRMPKRRGMGPSNMLPTSYRGRHRRDDDEQADR